MATRARDGDGFEVWPVPASDGDADAPYSNWIGFEGQKAVESYVSDANRADIDVMVDTLVANNVSVLLGNGNGTFQLVQNFSVGLFPSSVVVGDFDGDGKPDLAVTSIFENNLPSCDFSDRVSSITYTLAYPVNRRGRHISLEVSDHLQGSFVSRDSTWT